ncbi:MAG: hypothetical protein K2L59_03125, partial [Muribaculaceae bacterium]|nr:hypothetical protein [Muribaculaceae bacterium]
MKNSAFIIILLALGLLFVSYKWVSSQTSGQSSTTPGSDAIDIIMTRASVRAYTDREVSDETVDTLLRAAQAPPPAPPTHPQRGGGITAPPPR